MYELQLKFHWSLFISGPINNIPALVQIRNGLALTRKQAIIWTKGGYITDAYMYLLASVS